MASREYKDHIGGIEMSDTLVESSDDEIQNTEIRRRPVERMNTQDQIEYEQERREDFSGYSDDYYSEDEPYLSLDDGRNELKDVIQNISGKSIKFTRTADLFRYLNYLTSVIIIVGTFLVGAFLALDDYENKYVIWGSFGISAIKGIYDLFDLGKRGIRYFEAGYQLREKLRNARNALFMMRSGDDLYVFAQHLREEVDGIEFRVVRSMYGPEEIKIDIDDNVEMSTGGVPADNRKNQ